MPSWLLEILQTVSYYNCIDASKLANKSHTTRGHCVFYRIVLQYTKCLLHFEFSHNYRPTWKASIAFFDTDHQSAPKSNIQSNMLRIIACLKKGPHSPMSNGINRISDLFWWMKLVQVSKYFDAKWFKLKWVVIRTKVRKITGKIYYSWLILPSLSKWNGRLFF